MLEEVIGWLVPFVLGSAASGIGTYFGMRRKKNAALEDGLQCLLRAEIITYHERYEKSCPIYAKESLRRIYRSYHALGGNDVATGLYEKLMDLPEEP